MIRYLFFAVLVLFFTVNSVFAQFEGKVIFAVHEVKSNGDKEQNDRLTMFVTSDRILLQGENNYPVMGNLRSEGLLIRLDNQDFVILTGEKDAFKFTRSDIDAALNMAAGGSPYQQDKETDISVNYQKTGETRTILGYKCEKFIFSDREDPSDFSEVWMTNDLKINWGMLAEQFGSSKASVVNSDIPMEVIFSRGYFPLYAESYKNGKLNSVIEAVEVDKNPVARAMVQIPPGVQVYSFQEYLFKKLSDQ